jgi:heterodisulfide reductase subunit A-like polyferredoxin
MISRQDEEKIFSMSKKIANAQRHNADVGARNGSVGSVMVVGGGIGGVQAALDLAESGFYVYLVEKGPAIGGTMSQLDKTFPTNDCAMCILSPKVVEAGRNLNIELVTDSEVMGIEGEPGHFRVDIQRRPRYIDLSKCTACGECVKVCPVDRPSVFDENLANRKAIYKQYPQAIPSGYAIEKRDRPPCVVACPAGVNPQGYINLIREKRYEAALKIILEALPLPGVLGRVCPHPCEEVCRRRDVDEPLAICSLKRFVADQVDISTMEMPEIERKDQKVAIIGSGPAGLSAAYYLSLEGYGVTIFEALPVAGGMLRVGIPDYRLPPEVLETEIDFIRHLGVEIRLSHPVDRDHGIDELFRLGYSAVYIAVGAHLGNKLGVSNEDAEGVFQGVDFLRELNLGNKVKIGKRIAVIGGGNVAIDVARSCRRLGAEEITIVYRRSREEMPAWEEEIEAALCEGIQLHALAAPKEIIAKDGRVSGMRCMRMALGEPDDSGRRRPVPIEGSEFDLELDMLIPAIGQRPQVDFLGDGDGVELALWGGIRVHDLTYETNRPGVFAGGDAVTGPAMAVDAVGAGHEAAVSIIRYLEKEDLEAGRVKPEFLCGDLTDIPLYEEKKPRCAVPTIPGELRCSTFEEVNRALGEEEAVREASRCLNCGSCCECWQCVEACQAGAINHHMSDEHETVEVGAVILAPGFETVDAKILRSYGYVRFPNVVTSKEFERILSASGPFQGHMVRLSDKQEPKRIGWIQCAGSRNINEGDHGYCSSVCCMYAIKQAVIAKEHASDGLDATIFFMDMRTFGKDFEKYYDRASEEQDVRFVRSRIHSVVEEPETRNLIIRYVDEEGKVKEEVFDMLVLSVGMEPSPSAVELAQKVGVDLNHYKFCSTGLFNPVVTSRPGIFVCGAFEGPKDIPETVMQASSAAARAQALLAPSRNTQIKEAVYPEEVDISKEEPRIGVFVCDCGINIASVVRVPEVKKYAATLPGVVYADENLFTCSQDNIQRMIQVIREQGLNRVVVASCSPRTHEPLFRETIRQAGLNPYLFEMANIRDQGSWVHQKEPEKATEKAKDLVRMAVAKVRNARPLVQVTVPVEQSALVVGGGVAGMNAALNIAEQGYAVHLVELSDRLGGVARRVHYTIEGEDVLGYLDQIQKRVKQHPGIRLYLNTQVLDHSGFVGNFTTKLLSEGGEAREIRHGVTVVATGAKPYEPTEYAYGDDSRVLTSLELEERIARGDAALKGLATVVMIQCVGSRNEAHPYCSRICCQGSVKNALKLKAIDPSMQVFILYRDMRTYGLLEDYYKEAREKGVLFIRFEKEDPPKVEKQNGDLVVRVKDHVLREEVAIKASLISLAIGIEGHREHPLATRFKLPLNSDGFFMEAHMKLRPVDFSSEGNFLAGLAHGPKPLKDTIAQAEAAAARAVTILSKERLYLPGEKARVDDARCVACLTCVRACPYHVPQINENGVAEIEPAACQGCGICSSACPRKAIELANYTDLEILAKVAALKE